MGNTHFIEIHYLIMMSIIKVHLHFEFEAGSFPILWHKVDAPIELFNNTFADGQTETNPVFIEHFLSFVFDLPKETEEIWLVLILDSKSSISDSNLQELLVILFF